LIKNCLNPKCNREFTPKNNKGVYCSANCRAAHAYQMKRIHVNQSKTIELPADYVNVNKIAILTEDGKMIDLMDAKEPIPDWATKWLGGYCNLLKDEANRPIMEQIESINKEKIPTHRDTVMGRFSWQKEQEAKIKELQKKLK